MVYILFRACYGMEWKENFSIEYGVVIIWIGMEDFINGMEKVFHTPYIFHTY